MQIRIEDRKAFERARKESAIIRILGEYEQVKPICKAQYRALKAKGVKIRII